MTDYYIDNLFALKEEKQFIIDYFFFSILVLMIIVGTSKLKKKQRKGKEKKIKFKVFFYLLQIFVYLVMLLINGNILGVGWWPTAQGGVVVDQRIIIGCDADL